MILCTTTLTWSQTEHEDPTNLIQQMQEEIWKELQNLDFSQPNQFFFGDTLLFGQGFPMMPGDSLGWGNMPHMGSDDVDQLLNQLFQSLSEIDAQDWQDMEQLFRQFQPLNPPNWEGPSPQSEDEPDNQKPKKGQKKRRLYSL